MQKRNMKMLKMTKKMDQIIAIPDLKGEFLRGTETSFRGNSCSGGTDADVGKHQDATRHLYSRTDSESSYIAMDDNSEEVINPDYKNYGYKVREKFSTTYGINAVPIHYTYRPTNTAVLYCIKY